MKDCRKINRIFEKIVYLQCITILFLIFVSEEAGCICSQEN